MLVNLVNLVIDLPKVMSSDSVQLVERLTFDVDVDVNVDLRTPESLKYSSVEYDGGRAQ